MTSGWGEGLGIPSLLGLHGATMGLGEAPQHCPSLGHPDRGHCPQLFDHIIDCVIDFQMKQNLVTHMLPLGFTFSFPCEQVGLDKVRGWLQHQDGGEDPRMWWEAATLALLLPLLQALLLTWTKGFSASGCVGQDVVQLLREAAKRKQVGLVACPCPQGMPCIQAGSAPGAVWVPLDHMCPHLLFGST